MKKIILATAILFAIFVNAMVANAESKSPGMHQQTAHTDQVPERVDVGDFSILSAVAKIHEVRIVCSADSAPEDFTRQFMVSFNTIEALKQLISEIGINLKVQDPEDDIDLKVTLHDEDGFVLFNAENIINLRKVYDKDGNVSYQVPINSGMLYFLPSSFEIEFPNAMSAYLINGDGTKYNLKVDDDTITIYGWHRYQKFKQLIVQTANGEEYIYSALTGQKMDAENLTVNTGTFGFHGIREMPLDDQGKLLLDMSPESEYTPWIQVDASELDSVMLDVVSKRGFEPIAVWVASIEKLRSGNDPEPMKYQEGMTVEGDGTIYLWFEFPEWLYGIDMKYGEGKG